MNATLSDTDKTTTMLHDLAQSNLPARRDSLDTVKTAVDIEHVPVQDDPRSWSWLRKVSRNSMFASRAEHPNRGRNNLAFQSVPDIGGLDDCWLWWYDSES
jgi:hypothetical protein